MDWNTGSTLISRKVAGYSSPALLPLVVARVWQVSQAVSVPVLASGGVSRGEDVLELLAAGAEMVQVGTRLMRRPHAASELFREAEALLGGNVPRPWPGCSASPGVHWFPAQVTGTPDHREAGGDRGLESGDTPAGTGRPFTAENRKRRGVRHDGLTCAHRRSLSARS
jgi:hypothetical protein